MFQLTLHQASSAVSLMTAFPQFSFSLNVFTEGFCVGVEGVAFFLGLYCFSCVMQDAQSLYVKVLGPSLLFGWF